MYKTNILIVDDREENIIALEALIKRDDVNIISTTSPNEALKLAWENDISIALVDVQMPDIDGFELVRMLKSNPRTKNILVIFVTAISKESKYAVKGLEAGAVDYLYKPLDPSITFAKVDSFIQLAKAQNEIKQKNIELANFSTIVNNSADIICSVDEETLIIKSINPAFEKTTGFKITQILEKPVTDLVINDEKQFFLEQLKLCKESDTNHLAFETKFIHQTEIDLWVDCRVTCKIGNFFLNISDISRQKEISQQLIEAKNEADNARKAKEVFLANMSHELRTPINGIIGISNLLSGTNIDTQQKEMINLLRLSSESLLGIVNDILDLSKIESGKFTIVRKDINLKELLNSVTAILRIKAEEKLIDLKLEIDEDIPIYLEADSLRINQILMNLLSNAIKFTHKGSVFLKVQLNKINNKKANISFIVKDSGIGIPPNRLDSIFESYEQAEDDTTINYGGTGLGLTIVKKLAELKGGSLTVTSVLKEGSCFTFTNDFTISESNNKPTNKLDNQFNKLKGIKILIAEDNLVNQFMIKKTLNMWGVLTDTAESGLTVIEKLKETDYDLILMDTHMPDMGGFETTKIIRDEFSGVKQTVKIISLSAAVLEEEIQAALDAGMNDILTKPFVPEDLYYKICNQLNIK